MADIFPRADYFVISPEKPMHFKKEERKNWESIIINFIYHLNRVRKKMIFRKSNSKDIHFFLEKMEKKGKKKSNFFMYSGESDDLTGFLEILGFEVYNGSTTKLV